MEDFILENSSYPSSSLKPRPTKPQLNKIFSHSTFQRARFAELDLFRRQIEQSKAGLFHQPYTHNKKNTFFLKMLFFGFSLLFILLSAITLTVSFAPSWGILNLSSIGFAKSVVVTACSLLAITAFYLALSLRTEREAIFYCVRKARARLSHLYARKRIRCGVNNLLALVGPKRHITATIKQSYNEIYDRINDKKEDALHLVQRITTAQTLQWSEKEMLLNQAIEDFNEKLLIQIQNFKNSSES